MHLSTPRNGFLKRAVEPCTPLECRPRWTTERSSTASTPSLREFCRLLGRAAPDSRSSSGTGCWRRWCRRRRTASVVNSSCTRTPAGWSERCPSWRRSTRRAGVRAWTVWVPARRRRGGRRSWSGAGHVLDADPAAMAMELSALEAPRPAGPGPRPRGRARDRRAPQRPRLHLSAATTSSGRCAPPRRCTATSRAIDGRPVCCATGHDHDGDFSVTLVATLPEARGRGLAGRLLAHALHDARERGCTTTSLQATKLGHSVYAPARLPRPGRGADVGAPRRARFCVDAAARVRISRSRHRRPPGRALQRRRLRAARPRGPLRGRLRVLRRAAPATSGRCARTSRPTGAGACGRGRSST